MRRKTLIQEMAELLDDYPSLSHARAPLRLFSPADVRRRSSGWRGRSRIWNAIAIYRRKHDLLSADEIRTLRKRFSMTQGQLARLLRLGANTVSRWEAGRNVQTEAMDVLLRLLRDVPGNIRYLRAQAA